jgi:hypothetical protein
LQKLFYLLFEDANADGSLLREAIADRVVPILRGSGAEEISSFVADDEVAAGSPLRQSDPPIRAALSFCLATVDDRLAVEAALDDLVACKAGYLVRESRPIRHDRKVGHRTRGMMQMSCISQRPELSHEAFLRIWHQDHEKVAIETQSTFGYVRNEILGTLTEGAPEHWSAIVEEFFPIEALEDAMVFFDAETEAELAENRKRMLESCGRFLDLSRIEVTFMSETYFG